MAETFGEADVILRTRLDVLERDLSAAEMMIQQSENRLVQSQQRVFEDISQGGDGVSDGVLHLLASISTFSSTVRGKIKSIANGLVQVARSTAAASAAMVALGVAGIGVLGLLSDKVLRVREDAIDMIEAFKGMDGTSQKALEFADALGRIPIVGSLASKAFLIFSDDAGKSTEVLASLASKVKDGRVEVNLLGRAVNGLVNMSTPGIIARMLGIDTNLAGQINKINQEIEKTNQLLQIRQQFTDFAKNNLAEAGNLSLADRNASQLAGSDGPQRAMIESQQIYDMRMRQYDQLQERLNKFTSAQKASVRERLAAGEIDNATSKRWIDEITERNRMQTEKLQQQRSQSQESMRRAARQRIQEAQDQLKQEQEITAEQERRAELMRTNASNRLRANAAALETELGGDPFQADRIRLAEERAAAIRNAQAEGNGSLINDINAFYDARSSLIDAREQEQIDRDRANAEMRAQEMLQQNEDLRSRIRETRLQQQGDEAGAQEEAIRRRFQQQIDRLEEAGNQVGADLSRKLRDIEISGIGVKDTQSKVARRQEFEQVSASRIAAGGGSEQNKVEIDQLTVLRNIDRNTNPRNNRKTVATAG